MKPVLKKSLKVLAALIALPPTLLLILSILLYVPAVQNWAVKHVAAYASDAMDMNVSVERVRLRFPLDLGVYGFLATQPNDSLKGVTDTIADARLLVAGVKLMPLFDKRVDVKRVELLDAKINTAQFVPAARVRGRVGSLRLCPSTVRLSDSDVSLSTLRLSRADIDVCLSDTVPEDTTQSETVWRIALQRLHADHSNVTVHMPGDTLQMAVGLGRTDVTSVLVDLAKNQYQVGSLDWREGSFAYDNNFERPQKGGLDYNHIALSPLALRIDSLFYSDAGLKMRLRRCAFKEKCGLVVNEISGALSLDSVHVKLPSLLLRTPHSRLSANIDFDFNTFAEKNPGRLKAKMYGSFGKPDLQLFLGFMPKNFLRQWPSSPLSIEGSVDGNMQAMKIDALKVSLPGAFSLMASGKMQNLTDIKRLHAAITADAHTDDISFVTALFDPSLSRSFRIPRGISLKGNFHADGPRYAADFTASQGGGSVKGDARFDMKGYAYRARLTANSLRLANFLPDLAVEPFTGELTAEGAGLDFLSRRTWMEAKGRIRHFSYSGYDLSNMKLDATVRNGVGKAVLDSRNPLLNGIIDLRTLISNRRLDARLACDLLNADFYKIGLTKRPLSASLIADVELNSNLKNDHSARGVIGNIVVRDSARAYRPESISLNIFTRPDSTHAAVTCGDFALKMDGHGAIEHIIDCLTRTNVEAMKQQKERYINQLRLRERLPQLSFYLDAGKENVFSRTIRHFGYDYQNAFVDMSLSPQRGINGSVRLDSLIASGIQLDTVRLSFSSDSVKTLFEGQVRNNRNNPQYVFDARFRGAFHEQSLYLGTRVFDARNRLGVALGLRAQMEHNGVRLTLGGIDPVLGYKEFKVNKGNYIFFGDDQRLSADMKLSADDGMGVKIYSNDSTEALQDITVGLTRFDLAKVLSVVPYAPNISGVMNGDFHVVNNPGGDFTVSSSVSVAKMSYEGCPMGNISSEFVYMPKDGGLEHCVDGTLSMDGNEVCTLNGTYDSRGEGMLNAHMDMSRTPLNLMNGFIPDRIIGFKGYAQGNVTIKGTLSRPQVNGEVFFDSAYVVSEPYGVQMRLCDDPVTITDSHLQFENFQMFATNGSPLTLYGSFDFADMDAMRLNLRMRASNYLLINSKETARSEAYGKAYVNFLGAVNGRLDALRMRGRLDVLGSTDITYILRDSPLSSDNRLEGLVTFVDFRRPEQTTVQRPPINGLNMDLTVSIDEGAHVLCALNTDKSNYVDIIGGGDLRMLYDASDGLSLYGRYTIGSGEMKYSLPVIPLKTFNINEGGYVEFFGDPMNPRLNITATESTKATVTTDGGSGRSVAFECGVELTKTLNDMGLQFIIDAPDDQQIHNELMTMSAENRGKIAVTMLTTGMYLSDGNPNSLSVNSALSAFLNSQINAISGNALRTLDLSFGMDNTMLGSGQMHTDYSFKFAKRFWNNRLRIVIGGKVSSGAEVENQNETFFDNVTFEYRLSANSNKYLKFFYDRDSYDWLEGYVEQFGGGFMWRRKLQHFKDIFRFKKEKSIIDMFPADTTKQKRPATEVK